jgi:hypothetical protein
MGLRRVGPGSLIAAKSGDGFSEVRHVVSPWLLGAGPTTVGYDKSCCTAAFSRGREGISFPAISRPHHRSYRAGGFLTLGR